LAVSFQPAFHQRTSQGGAISLVQELGSSLNATPHYHCLVLDGVYAFTDETKEPFFIETPPPADEDVGQIAETVAEREIRLLTKRTTRLSAAALRAMARSSTLNVQGLAEASAQADLKGESLPTEAPPIAPARSSPQMEFEY
jgi:hypothetical protein